MSANTSVNQANGKSDLTRKIRKRMVQVVAQFMILAAILFISSGRPDWVWAWAYLGVNVGILAINLLVVSPELIAERSEIKGNVKAWDKVLATLISVLTLGAFVVIGLDKRFGWSPQLDLAIHLVALIFWALGQGLFSWAMASNKFFSGAVRIQMDRDHTVVTSGPYQYVRHPGYVGYIASFFLATPLALGSLWALIPGGLGVLLLIIRTALEDRTLLEELDGYQEYGPAGALSPSSGHLVVAYAKQLSIMKTLDEVNVLVNPRIFSHQLFSFHARSIDQILATYLYRNLTKSKNLMVGQSG